MSGSQVLAVRAEWKKRHFGSTSGQINPYAQARIGGACLFVK